MIIENNLKETADKLGLRFPIAQISKDLNYSKGVISQYYNNKKELSENFINHFESFYNVKISKITSSNDSSSSILSNNEELDKLDYVADLKKQIEFLKKQVSFLQDKNYELSMDILKKADAIHMIVSKLEAMKRFDDVYEIAFKVANEELKEKSKK